MTIPNPLDDNQPIPEYRAPGEAPSPVTVDDASPAWEGASPIYANPDRPPEPNKGQLLKQQQMEALKREDAEIRVMAAALRLTGRTVKDIAKLLSTTEPRIRRVLRQARQDGNLNDVLSDLNFDALPLAMEKLLEKVEKGEEWAIKETLKVAGLGTYNRANEGQQDNRQLQVNFIMPAQPTPLNPKGIVGKPRGVIDAVQVTEAAAEVPRDGSAGGDQPQDGGGVRRGDEGEAGGLPQPAGEREGAPSA